MFAYQNPLDNIKKFFKSKSPLVYLICINLGVLILVHLTNVVCWLFEIKNHAGTNANVSLLTYYLSLPADLGQISLRPWTLLTYMFLHENILHFLLNMIVLYFGGRIFLEYLTERKLLSVYILGGIAGALFYIGAFNFFPVFKGSISDSRALGASASVLAILFAIATYVPNYIIVLFIFGRVKLKYLALIIVLVDILSIPLGNAGGHIAHLGGAFWGFLYIILLKQGSNLSFRLKKINFGHLKFKKRKTTYENTYQTGRPLTDEEYNYRRKEKQERIDEILEKIARSGYSSLTKEEKALLFQSSNKNNS